MRRKKNFIGFLLFFLLNFTIFLFFYFKGEILCKSFVTEEKMYSYNVVYLITCYVQLLFRCYYSTGSSVDC